MKKVFDFITFAIIAMILSVVVVFVIGDGYVSMLASKFSMVETLRIGAKHESLQPVESRLGGLVNIYEAGGVKYTRSPMGERIEFEESFMFRFSRDWALKTWKKTLKEAGYKEVKPGVYEVKGVRLEITTGPQTIRVVMKPAGVRGLFM